MIVNDILNIYECYNPFFNYIVVEAEQPITPYLHQIEFNIRTLFRRPLRVFIADEIGLGKTITALTVLRKFWRLGESKKVLIIVPRILVSQWIWELMRLGFSRYIKRIERDTVKGLILSGFPDGIYIASMDLIKLDRYYNVIKDVNWDTIIVDEAHRLGKNTDRYNVIGEKLIKSNPCRNVILLSATPHRGDPEDYLCRLEIIDPYLWAGKHLDNVKFYGLTHNVIIFRRSKIDVNDVYEERKVFTDCNLEAVVISASSEERDFQVRIIRFLRTKLLEFYSKIGVEPKAMGLLTAVIFKRTSSSPYAAIKTLERMIKMRAEYLKSIKEPLRLIEEYDEEAKSISDTIFGFGFDDYSDYYGEVESVEPDEVLNEFAAKCSILLSDEDEKELKGLVELAKRIAESDSRLNAVKLLVKEYIKQNRKVIIFSEYKDTINYIYKAFMEEFGEERLIKLTSDEVRDENELRKIRNRFERDPRCMIMLATDVASEGLNLQVANVVINYEIPWSPVKLEQRMGRVWRLGQTKDVLIHTIFLATDTDRDVLDIIYKKLIAVGRSTGIKKSLVGETTIVIDMRGEELPLQLSQVVKGEKRVKPTEYTLISEYVKGGREALDAMVEQIVRMISKLKEDLRKFNILPKIDKDMIKLLIYNGTGFKDSIELFNKLIDLLKSLIVNAKKFGINFEFKDLGNKLIVISSGGAPIEVNDCASAYKVIRMILNDILSTFSHEMKGRGIPYIVAYSDEDATLLIYEVLISYIDDKGLEHRLYEEPIGVYLKDDIVNCVRGSKLMELVSKAINKMAFKVDEYKFEQKDEDKRLIESKLISLSNDLLRRLNSDFNKYREELSRNGWRQVKDNWQPDLKKCKTKVGRLIGIIEFTSESSIAREHEIDPLTKRSIENRAMMYALKYERENNREAIDVSDREHFDILSRDPKSGEIRYIEVKGHAGTSLIAELSEKEYNTALEKGDKYWLYIVHSIELGKPQLIAVKDPTKNMKISTVETKKYILKP